MNPTTIKSFRVYLSAFSLRRFLLLFTVVSFLSINSFSQRRFLHERIKFERISTKNGISSNTVFSISESNEGFLWIATANGLNRFDGYSAKVFMHSADDSSSLSDNRVLTTLEDNDGTLWVGTMQGGLERYDPNSKKFIHYKDVLNNTTNLKVDRVFALYRDSQGILWIGSSAGLFTYEKKYDNLSARNDLLFQNETISAIRCIKEDYLHNLWVGTANGLYKIDGSRKKSVKFIQDGTSRSISNNFINSITFDKNNNVYAATENGVNIYNPETNSFTILKSDRSGNKIISNLINSVLIDKSGYLWIGTNRGLYIFDKTKKELRHFNYSTENSNSISYDFINHIFEDRSGNIWISTFSGGFNKYIKMLPNIETYPSQTFMHDKSSNTVITVNQIDQLKLLIGTSRGLGILDQSKKTFKALYQKLVSGKSPLSSCITCLANDGNSDYWFGTLSKGLAKLNLQTLSLRNFTPENSNIADCNINALKFDHDGVLWVGTLSGGLKKFDKKNNTFIPLSNNPKDINSLSSNRVKNIFIDSKNNVWVGTEDGLNLLDQKTNRFKRFQHSAADYNSISGNIITSVVEDLNGTLWIGTLSNGLNSLKLSTGKFTHVGDQFSLLSSQIKGLLVDNQNCLWISTINGLFRYDINHNLLSAFDENDGLQGNDFLESSQYKLPDGRLVFCGTNGMNIIEPNNLFEEANNHQIVITDFKVFGKSKDFDKDISDISNIDLDYTENYFTIEFASLDLRNSSKINYSYKMEGFDKDWVDCGKRRYAGYMNLKGDDYIFKIRASRNDGSWYESQVPLKIRIAAPPWERWYAYVIYFLFAFALVTVIVKIRTRIQNQNIRLLEERQKILAQSKQTLTNLIRRFTQLQEEERSYISRELHDGINQTIASIKLGVDRLRMNKTLSKEVVSDLDDIQVHLRAIISEIRNISQNIRPSILDDFGIFSAVENLCREYEMKTGVVVEIKNHDFDGRLGYEVESNLYRMIQESLNNIRKHSEATVVEISFSKKDTLYYISIKDNGVGFNTQNVFTPEFAREHFGLNNIKKRAELIGASFIINSTKGTGTELIIKLSA